jgi:hypothetical protein
MFLALQEEHQSIAERMYIIVTYTFGPGYDLVLIFRCANDLLVFLIEILQVFGAFGLPLVLGDVHVPIRHV